MDYCSLGAGLQRFFCATYVMSACFSYGLAAGDPIRAATLRHGTAPLWLAGGIWYFQFFFYTMGETQMGAYKFSSWTLHIASIIILGGNIMKEGARRANKDQGTVTRGAVAGIDNDCWLWKLFGDRGVARCDRRSAFVPAPWRTQPRVRTLANVRLTLTYSSRSHDCERGTHECARHNALIVGSHPSVARIVSPVMHSWMPRTRSFRRAPR